MTQLTVRPKLKPGPVEQNDVRAACEQPRRAAPAALRSGDRVEHGPVVTAPSRVGASDGGRS
jgi:hypothetical protein